MAIYTVTVRIAVAAGIGTILAANIIDKSIALAALETKIRSVAAFTVGYRAYYAHLCTVDSSKLIPRNAAIAVR